MFTIPNGTLSVGKHRIQIEVNDTQDVKSNEYQFHVLESMVVKSVHPSSGLQGITNRFYLQLEHYYSNMSLQCKFQSPLTWKKQYLVSAVLQNSSTCQVYCELPPWYIRRGPRIHDKVELSVSATRGDTWTSVAVVDIYTLQVDSISPSIAMADV